MEAVEEIDTDDDDDDDDRDTLETDGVTNVFIEASLSCKHLNITEKK